MQIKSELPTLTKVWATSKQTSRGTRWTYTGIFNDGSRKQLRSGFNCYVTVGQINFPARPQSGSGQYVFPANPAWSEFVFSSKPTIRAPKYGALVATVAIGLDA